MADFNTPFANTGARRSPDVNEKANGFPCGAADQTLFNGMFHRIEAELGAVISYAGLTQTDADFTQVRQAISLLIAAATGGGATEDYLLIAQAMTRLPIYPEVKTADGRINITSPGAGTVRLPGGVDLLHRGINLITTAETDFPTLSNRTYHLRWTPDDSFQLKPLTDVVYNPEGYPENHVEFDSTFDDILLARITTNSTNVATITPLSNKALLETAVGSSVFTDVGPPGSQKVDDYVLDWARTPQLALSKWSTNATGNANDGIETALVHGVQTRYGFSVQNYTISPTANRAYGMIYQYSVRA